MSLTLFDAMKSSRNPFQTAMFKQLATSDEMFSIMPFEPTAGEAFSYEREVSLGSFAAMAPGGSTVESTGVTEAVTISNRQFNGDFKVMNFAQEGMADQVSPYDRQLAMKLKKAGQVLAGKMVTGGSISGYTNEAFQSGVYVDALVSYSVYVRTSDRRAAGELKYTHSGTLLQFRAPDDQEFGTAVACAADGDFTLTSKDPSKWIRVTLDVSDATADAIRRITFTASNEFDGLQKQVATSQLIASTGTDGDALSFTTFRKLRDKVKIRDGKLAYVASAELIQKYEALVTALGGVVPTSVMEGGGIVPTFGGIPILRNDNIPNTEAKGSATTLSSLYLGNFGPNQGVHMRAFGGAEQQVMADPRDRTVLGFRVWNIGQMEAASAQLGRLEWYGGMACGSDLSLARASGIITL